MTKTKENTNLIAAVAAVLLVIAATWRPPMPDPRIGFEMIFFFCVFCLLAAVLWIRPSTTDSFRTNSCGKWWGFFLVTAYLSYAVAFYISPYTVLSWAAFQAILAGIIWYFLLVAFVNNHQGTKHLMDAICVIALMHVAFVVLQEFNMDPLWRARDGSLNDPAVGLMANENELSGLLAFCFPAFLRSGWVWLLFVPAAGLVTAGCDGGPIAVLIGLVCYALMLNLPLQYKAVIPIAALIFIGQYLYFKHGNNFCHTDTTDSGFLSIRLRFDTFKYGFDGVQQRPVLGWGLGHWKMILHQFRVPHQSTWWMRAHNEYLQIVFEMGIMAAVIICGYLVSIFRRLKKHAIIPTTAVIIIMANSFINFPFHIATTALVAITWFGILEISLGEAKKATKAIC